MNTLLHLIVRNVWFLLVMDALPNVLPQNQKVQQSLVQMCESQVYCQGPILEAVNAFRLYNDSKDYVDMPLIHTPDQVLADFMVKFPNVTNVTLAGLKNFISLHFLPAGHELLPYTPPDWKQEPNNLRLINDTIYRKWASDMNKIWLRLCKKIDTKVLKNAELFSLIYIPYPFVVPGGRFREYYYWDSYWVTIGLLFSEMYNTTKFMLKNYVELVDRYGFIPNGGRVYYLKRSQPPFLIPSVYRYYQETGDKQFVFDVLPTLEKEFLFWSTNRMTEIRLKSGQTYSVYLYNTPSNVPRPESYFVDVENAKNLSETDKPIFFSNIASAAETGWDFSSRWFGDRTTIRTVRTKRILPVDLNAFVCGNMRLLSELFKLTGQYSKSRNYEKQHAIFVTTLMDVFYNSTSSIWFDYDLDSDGHNTNFYPSSFAPLFSGCYKFAQQGDVEKLLAYLNNSGALIFPGGIPTSLFDTSQQWDFPNGWSPLIHMIIEGFRKSGNVKLEATAFRMADVWLKNNFLVFNRTSFMFEKYDVTEKSTPGGGGEYAVQVGFDWTNAVALDLLRTYGDRLVAPKK